MNEHLTETDVSAFLDGQMDPDKTTSFQGHVLMCALCRHEVESFRSLQLRLAKLPIKSAPPQLIYRLKKTFVRVPLHYRMREWFSLPLIWKPIGVAALGALIFGLWVVTQKEQSDDYVALEPLITAHNRYEAESLIPSADMAHSQYSAQLTRYYNDKN